MSDAISSSKNCVIYIVTILTNAHRCPRPVPVRAPWLSCSPSWSFAECVHTVKLRWRTERWMESKDCSNQKWKNRRGPVIDSCLACCPLRLFPPSTAIINRRSSPSPWQRLCHPSPLEDAIPFGRRWIGVPLPCMRSLCTESLQGEHSGENSLNVNNSIISISVKKKEKKFCLGLQREISTFILNSWNYLW